MWNSRFGFSRIILLSCALVCGAALLWQLAIPPVHAEPPPPAAAPEDDGVSAAPGPNAAWDTVIDADAETPAAPQLQAASATDCLGWPTRRIRYTSDGVIHLEGCGQSFTLSDVAAAPAVGPTRLELTDPANKIWLLKVKLKVEEGATLQVVGGDAGDANWLRLRSDASSGIWLRAENGGLRFQDTKVTSWDTAANAVDTNTAVKADGSGGRSYIAVRSVYTPGRSTVPPTACSDNGGGREPYEGRMDIANSEIAYLGYYAAESYGIIWKVYSKTPPPGRELYAMLDVFGDVRDSTFHHNYFGSYTFGAYCMRWERNLFEHNVKYGLDPHDDSDFLTIDNNIFRDNGDHGVICSVECNNLVITNNQSYRNQHGIMIHRNVNGALIEGNQSHDNRAAGIAIFDSHDAVVRNNTVWNNGESAVRLSVGSSGNLVANNSLTGLAASGAGSGYAIYTYKGSDLPTSGDGKPKNNLFLDNRLSGFKNPLIKLGDSVNNRFERSIIEGVARNVELKGSTGNVLADTAPGMSIQVSLDSASDLRLADSRGLVWQTSNGLSTAAGPSESALKLTVNAAASVGINQLDFDVRPVSGTVAVQPAQWDAGTQAWTERSTDATGPVQHRVGGLQPGACYDATAGGAALGRLTADGAGAVQFAYSGGYSGAVPFGLTPAPCSGTEPLPTATPTPMAPTATPTAQPTPTAPPTSTPPASTPPATTPPTAGPAPESSSVFLPLLQD